MAGRRGEQLRLLFLGTSPWSVIDILDGIKRA
jgi:hypothetical protein